MVRRILAATTGGSPGNVQYSRGGPNPIHPHPPGNARLRERLRIIVGMMIHDRRSAFRHQFWNTVAFLEHFVASQEVCDVLEMRPSCRFQA